MRDTIPAPMGAMGIDCEHCGCDAVAGEPVIGEHTVCATCAHPGLVSTDTTDALAWFLLPGRCDDRKCGDCYPELVAGMLQTIDELEQRLQCLDAQLFAQPDAQALIAEAHNLALSLRITPSSALRVLVLAIYRDLERAKENLALVERTALQELAFTRHVSSAAATFARQELS